MSTRALTEADWLLASEEIEDTKIVGPKRSLIHSCILRRCDLTEFEGGLIANILTDCELPDWVGAEAFTIYEGNYET